MLRWLRRVVPCTAIALLTLATPAAAMCAWVLWQQVGDVGGVQTWSPLRAQDAKLECGADREQLMSRMVVSKTPGIQVTRVGETLMIVTRDRVTSYSFTCLPDTIDPRGPKAK